MNTSKILLDVEYRKWHRQMESVAKWGIPRVAQGTVNEGAFELQKRQRRSLATDLIKRNEFATRSLRVDKAQKHKDVRRISARVFSHNKYIATQNRGGIVRPRKQHVAIPMKKARTARDKKRSVAKRYRLMSGGTARKIAGSSSANQNIFIADIGKGTGMFERTRSGSFRKLRHMHSGNVRIPASRWYSNTNRRFEAQWPAFSKRAFSRRAKRYLDRAVRRAR